jgi:hypothetical protein
MKEYKKIYKTHFGDSYSNGEIPVQDIRINGKSLGRKGTRVILNEEMEPCEREGISRLKRSIDIIIEKPKEDKKKKEEDLKEFKFQCKRNLMYEIAKLLRRIGDYAEEIEVQEFTAKNILMPLEYDKTYGITVDKEKHQALMINRLFDGFEEIDGMKGKDLPKVESILKKVRDGIDAFTKKKEEDFKHNCEVKARRMGKTQEMKDIVFAGIDFGKAYNVGRGLKVGIKNGQPYVEEI